MAGSVATARRLRRNSTEAENKLWACLKLRGLAELKFRRQHPIGKYVADFACIEHRLIIELDGGQHAENARDALRTELLEKSGWRVVRFWNNEVLNNPHGVLEKIIVEIGRLQNNPLPREGERAG